MVELKYRICHVQRNEHSQAFTDVCQLLFFSLADLGYDVDLSPKLSASRRNILVGANQIDEPIPAGVDYIPLQLEQLPGKWWSEKYHAILGGAQEVWDYCPQNLEFLKREYGMTMTKLITLGYHECLHHFDPAPKQIDVLFYGSLNDRRRKVLAECEALGLNVRNVFGIYGRDRDELIAQSRVVLNMHFYEQQIFEQARVFYLLTNGATVVTESSTYDPYWNVGFVRSPYELLAQTCKAVIEKGCEGTMAQQVFRDKHKMTEILREVLR